MYSVGMGQYKTRTDTLNSIYNFFHTHAEIKACVMDVANGYNVEFVDFVSKVREILPIGVFLIAGNVVTAPQTEQLLLAGANAVKIGIGSGSVCTTRKVTGVGYPQLSAIMECADAAHGLGGFIISDGGCQVPGDICKAFGAGADFVMLGGMLSGHEEAETTRSDGKVDFYGSSSKTAMGESFLDYRSSEGKSVTIQNRGPVENTIKHILGGLRSCCTYVGAYKLKELSKRTTFIRVQNGHQYNTVFGDSNEIT
jgi:GMP reductase